ncbi:PA3496 family putative envelope integrity protein [Stutzerimonas kirkiae]|uniref:PA3496 family putative envelope integrity protein n=1 Tax=Stutzerimonas kirkiae TaxID=2211392 RepID=UPI0013F147B7|nr:hypothetical protein [Stutzerimonas kirkiae]
MSDKDDSQLEDDFITDDEDDANTPIEVAKTNLTKRRIIDNLLEERRLQKQLNEYDFDL